MNVYINKKLENVSFLQILQIFEPGSCLSNVKN